MSLAKAGYFRVISLIFLGGVISAQSLPADEVEPVVVREQGCTFRTDPSQFLNAQRRIRESVHRGVQKFTESRASASDASPQAAAVRRNFIYDEIFGKLEQLNV